MALGTPTNLLQVYDNVDRNAYTTASVTLTAGRGYILTVTTPNVSTTTPTKPTVSGAGIGSWGAEFQDLLYDDTGATRSRQTMWVISNAAGSSGTIVIDYGGVSQAGCVVILDEFTGHNTAALTHATNIATGGNDTAVTTRSVTLAALQSASNAAYGVFNHQGNEAPLTIGSGYTQIGEVHGNNPNTGQHSQFQVNATVCDCTWTGSQRTGVIAVEIQAAASGPSNTVAPAVTGNKWTGQTLTSSTGTWTGTGTITYAYQWKRDGSSIGGATASTHVLVSGDETHSITCVVTATDSIGSASATSNAIVGGPSYTATNVLREEWCDFAFVAYTPGVTVLAPPITLVRIAPGSNASDRYPSWTDVSSLVRSFTYTRGRQTELDQAEVGTASVVFDNKSRVLDPSYTAGPFYPNLLPNMQISIQASYGTIVYDLFRGYVERFTTGYTGPNYAETTLECVDGMASLSNVTITGDFDQQTTGERVLAVLGAAGWPTTTSPSGWTLGTDTLGATTVLAATIPVNIIDTGRATVAATTILAQDEKGAVAHIQEVVDSEPGRFFFDGSNVAVFQDRSHVVPVPDTPVLTLTDDPNDTTGIPYRDVVVNYEIDRIHNDIQLQAIDGTVTAVFDTPSITRYWRRTLSRQTQLRAYDSDLYQQAGWLLRQSKDPLLRILQVSVDAYNTTTFRALHPLGLGDHITVTRTPPGLTAERLQQDSVIERLTVTAVPGPVWRFVYELSSLGTEPAPWVLGQAALGTSTTLVFA